MTPTLVRSTLAGLALSLSPLALAAQNPVATALRAGEVRAARNLTEAADEMPVEKYGYKPTPAQMGWGQVVLHVAGGSSAMCGWIAGVTPPEQPKLAPTDSKDKLVARLKSAFDFCSTSLASVTDANLGDSVPFFGNHKVTRAMAMMILVDDWADHYSQMSIYLRLNGLVPPTAKRGEM